MLGKKNSPFLCLFTNEFTTKPSTFDCCSGSDYDEN